VVPSQALQWDRGAQGNTPAAAAGQRRAASAAAAAKIAAGAARSTLPLVFSLWLMTTPEDRALLLHPHRFRSEAISLQPVRTEREEKQYAERLRLGINLM
jgi:hypothetical protein